MGRGRKPLLDARGRKKCANCEEYKELADFSPSTDKAFGVSSWCKMCIAQVKNTRYTLEKARAEHHWRGDGLSMEENEKKLTGQKGLFAGFGPARTKKGGGKERVPKIPLVHMCA